MCLRSLDIKMPKHMQTILHGERRLWETWKFFFFISLNTKSEKNAWKALYLDKQNDIKKKKTCILSIFHIVSYSYGKIHANHSVWRNKMTNRNMSFQCFCHPNAKMYGNHAIMKKQNNITKNVSSQCFCASYVLKRWNAS